jgi:hypothetical protein
MAFDSDSAAARRAARSNWPITEHRLDGDQTDDLSDCTTAVQRVAMMKELAETAWLLSGRSLPTYARRDIPGRLFERGEVRPENDDS